MEREMLIGKEREKRKARLQSGTVSGEEKNTDEHGSGNGQAGRRGG